MKKGKKTVNKAKNSETHKCNECPAFFSTEGHYRRHRNLHLNDSGAACRKCGWLVPSGAPNMTYHMWMRHPKPGTKIGKPATKGVPFYCDHCHMIMISENHLQRHHRSFHRDMRPHCCAKCDGKLISKQLLEMHMERDHPDLIKKDPANESPLEGEAMTEELQCEHCSETFDSKLKLDYHIATIHPSSLLKCRLCDYHPKTYSYLHAHMGTRHDPNRSPKRTYTRTKHGTTKLKVITKLICELCSKELNNKHSLEGHMLVFHHKEMGLEPERCPEPGCERVFPDSNKLRMHIKAVHHKIRDTYCEYCGKAFFSQGTLNKHLLIHTGPRELRENYKHGPYICEYCPPGTATFNVRQGLYFHRKKMHNDKYAYHCGKCGMGYEKELTLTQHEKQCKADERIKYCEYCAKGFTNQKCLDKHLLIHTAPDEVSPSYKNGPFTCEHCPSGTATFNVRQALRYHMQKFHKDRFPFHCGKCGMGYDKDYKVSLHEKTCKGKKEPEPVVVKEQGSPSTDETESPIPSTSSSNL